MSTIPTVEQTRRAITLANGDVRFEVTSLVTDEGDLPFTNLFVLSIVDPGDPKDDKLARIATPYDIRQTDPSNPTKYIKVVASDIITIAGDPFARISSVDDLTGLPRDRTVAVATGRAEYLSSSVTLVYDTLTTADAAYKQIIARLSELVEVWRTTFGAFVTSPSTSYALPRPGSSVEDERVAAYEAAKRARETAEASRDSAAEASEACTRDCTTSKAIYDFLVVDVAYLEASRAVVVPLAVSDARSFALGIDAYVGDTRTYENLLTFKRNQLAIYAAEVAACSTRCRGLSDALAAAERTLAGALATERDRLAEVYEVCPTFDPSTV